MTDYIAALERAQRVFREQGRRLDFVQARAERYGRMRAHRRRNRRVKAWPKRAGEWRCRLYRDGRPIARGTFIRPGFVTWTVAYSIVEYGDVDDAGRYVFLGYGDRAWS